MFSPNTNCYISLILPFYILRNEHKKRDVCYKPNTMFITEIYNYIIYLYKKYAFMYWHKFLIATFDAPEMHSDSNSHILLP
jgi:hypothetical protein